MDRKEQIICGNMGAGCSRDEENYSFESSFFPAVFRGASNRKINQFFLTVVTQFVFEEKSSVKRSVDFRNAFKRIARRRKNDDPFDVNARETRN